MDRVLHSWASAADVRPVRARTPTAIFEIVASIMEVIAVGGGPAQPQGRYSMGTAVRGYVILVHRDRILSSDASAGSDGMYDCGQQFSERLGSDSSIKTMKERHHHSINA
jgi:hypothetical protein